MKIICDKKGWRYQQGHTAKPLIDVIISKAAIETHFEQPLVFIAWLRNNYGSAHGAGTSPKMATESLALFGINLTASAILFLSRETL